MSKSIGDLTTGEIKEELAALFGLNSMIGLQVIVRTYSSGVWYGKVTQKAGKEIIVSNARRMNYFKTLKGISLSSVANNGVHRDSRIAEAVDSVWLEAIELIPCTKAAIESIERHVSE